MNSIKWFNFNYLLQNLKKSKAVLAIFLIIVPLLSTLVLIISSQGNSDYVSLDFNTVSLFAIVGMYIIPIIVSFALFGYVFKRKSSDFVNSMPLNRSTIFITNTVGGILLLIAMILISTLLILITSCLLPNIIVSGRMMIDYFIIWSVAYIFVFTATNLAASVSGNVITSLAVTALLLFLIPFLSQSFNGFNNYTQAEIKCTEKSCIPQNFSCFNDDECLNDQEQGIYSNKVDYDENNKYNLAYTYPSNIFANYYSLDISSKQIAKMFIGSIIFFTAGLYLFRKKRMEVTETSFHNIHAHNIIKSLTIIPMLIFACYNFDSRELSFNIFLIVVIFVYYLIFDLITRKHLTKFSLTIVYFVVTTVLVTGYYYTFVKNTLKPGTTIDSKEIKEIAIVNPSGYADTSDIYIQNDELKNLVVKNILNNNFTSTEEIYQTNLKASIKLNNGKVYKVRIDNILEKDYKKMMSIAYQDEKFINALKDIDYKNVYAISSSYLIINPKDNDKILDMIRSGIKNTSVSNYENLDKGFDVVLYTYKDHKQVNYVVNSAINPDLTRYISKYSNDKLKKNVIDKNKKASSIHGMYAITIANSDNDTMTDYVIERSYSEIYEFIKNNINKSCDVTKDYVGLSINVDNTDYVFYTNNVEGFKKILDEQTKKYENTEDYQNYKNMYAGEEHE